MQSHDITTEQAIGIVRPFVDAFRQRGPKPALSIHRHYGWTTRGARVVGVDADGITISDHYDGAHELVPWAEIDSLTVAGGCSEVSYTLTDDDALPVRVATMGEMA